MSMDKNSLRQLIRSHILEESRKGKYSLNYELADVATSESSLFKPNTNQGAVKGRNPHTRIAASPEAVKEMSDVMQKIKAAGGFTSIYSDQALYDEFVKSFQQALGNPPIEILGTAGSPGEYSDTFPALEVKFTLSSGESARGVLVPTFASARVAKGKVYQDSTAKIVDNALKKIGIVNTDIQTAQPGSQVADVQVNAQDTSGNPISFNLEVKGPGGKFFDKTLQRGMKTQNPEIKMINDIAAAIAKSKGYSATDLESYIDQLRAAGETNVGYIGDPGITQKSGALPKKHFSAPMTPEILAAIKSHWASGGDTYFVVADGTTSYMWYTGHPASSGPANPLKLPDGETPVPEFDVTSVEGDIELSTYGSAGPGRLRVALKAKFNLSSSAALTESLGLSDLNLVREFIREVLLTEAFAKTDE